MTADAFRATYSDFKLVKTRGIVQVIFEIPLAEVDAAYHVLGGMPDIGKERWFGIAPLNMEGGGAHSEPTMARPEHKTPPVSALDRLARASKPPGRTFNEIAASQQAGILCNDKAFCIYLQEKHAGRWRIINNIGTDTEKAAEIVRSLCKVTTRSALNEDDFAAKVWKAIVSDYRAWVHEPELVG